jgi:hypothetical protein
VRGSFVASSGGGAYLPDLFQDDLLGRAYRVAGQEFATGVPA